MSPDYENYFKVFEVNYRNWRDEPRKKTFEYFGEIINDDNLPFRGIEYYNAFTCDIVDSKFGAQGTYKLNPGTSL